MKPPHRFGLLAAALLCAAPLTAPAQGPRVSHVPIPTGIEPGLADQYLTDRYRQAETAARMERLLTDLARNPEKLDIPKADQDVLKKAGKEAGDHPEKMLQDPQVRRIIGEAAAKQGKLPEFTPEERQRLEEFARQFIPPSGPEPPLGMPPPHSPVPPPGKPADPLKPPGGPDHPSPPPGVPPPGATPAAPPPPSAPPARSPVQERFRDLAEALADKGLADSPAFRRMLTNLDRVKGPEASDYGRWERRFQGVEERFTEIGMRLPKFSWPKTDFAPRDAGERIRRAAADPQEVVGDGAGSTLLMLLAAGAAGLAAWGLMRRRGLMVFRRAGAGAVLGPWPVRPEAVATRDDLVRAFEYLALLRLGQAARSRNHREIAASLGAEGAARHSAAERLAGLYEQARYAPPDEALPDADLAAARADLSLLAGVAAA